MADRQKAIANAKNAYWLWHHNAVNTGLHIIHRSKVGYVWVDPNDFVVELKPNGAYLYAYPL